MPETMIDPSRFSLLGGRLCLDFANTADWHASEQPVEFLHTYGDLLAWGQLAGVLTEDEVASLSATATNHGNAAAAMLERAIAFREALYRLFSAHVRGGPVSQSDLELVNMEIADAYAHRRLVSAGGAFSWEWIMGRDTRDLARILWPVALSVAEVTTSPDLGRVRECAGDPCGWLFLDTSRSRSRRWCNMESCGNRAKARRHYERQRARASRAG
jgi:predicted RNA-binding Zn ribbon-like protein